MNEIDSGFTSRIGDRASCLTRMFWGIAWILLLGLAAGQAADEPFEHANKLYEEGHYQAAAAMYQTLIDQGEASSTLYFNQGNAYFKSGEYGRAIAAYRQGQSLDPRDPDLRFNLQFARKQVTGNESISESIWKRALTALTVNEWTILLALIYWIWLALLCLRELRPGGRRIVSGYTATAGILSLVLGGCVAGAWHQWYGVETAVVIAQETLVRYGPLEESQVNFQLPDGSEVTVLDRKDGTQSWLHIRDAASREGWLKDEDVIVPRLPNSHPKAS